METIIYENSLRAQSLVDYLARGNALSRYNKVYVLPIPSSRDGVLVSGTSTPLDEALRGVNRGDLVIGYGLSAAFAKRIGDIGASLCDSSRDEKFLLENARLTAEAALGILLGIGGRSLSDMRVGIVGYGRICLALLSMLLYLGARVTVFTRRADVALELASSGVSALGYADLGGEPLDALVNTAPSDELWRVSGESVCSSGARVIELASGDNFPEGVSRGLNVTSYPSLPARCFPVSAGEAWGRSVERFACGDEEGFSE